ncbi:hypothetical protein BD410DRAFT_845699 [Rickenella mellea]|uniref:CxC2-like cysteine cluster KDZ transposase-associated domain-containing protein n=1 Tax=Rickenella mellea TaxID=50990 RepID=A0A4Y7PIK5_9AGAM|nr:hypothetical protein BD410DRAFT_845699 [Rickenella mellea]
MAGNKLKAVASVKFYRHPSTQPARSSTKSHLSRHVHINRVKERVRKRVSPNVASNVASPVAPEPVAPDDMSPDDCHADSEDHWMDEPEPVIVCGPKKRMRTDPLNGWKHLRDDFLDEMIRHDGLGSETLPLICASESCNIAAAFRCVDCFDRRVMCSTCMCREHHHHPLHQIEVWTGGYFEKTSLHALGFTMHLGHNDGVCAHAIRKAETLTVIHMTGIHTVSVKFCECPRISLPRRTQLLRVRWWPATIDRPQTVTTFAALDMFLELTLQSKVNMYDFYLSLEHLSDNTGTRQLKYRYKEFGRCVRGRRHLQLAKRSARGHDPEGIKATQAGEFVVECPACPQPGRNLPEGWENQAEDERYKYALFLAMDANFRLKSKDRGIRDTALGDGWGYFVPSVPFKEHVSKYIAQPEMNTCESKLRAVDHANVRSNAKILVNGVGGVNCSRHALNRRIGFGDLQRGEKYCNMDFCVLSTLHDVKVTTLYLSYDIACQWFVNLPKRMDEYPHQLQVNPNLVIIVAIPKLHLVGHGPKCQTKYSLNFIPGSARTCGESIEQIWSGQNAVAMSTREMSPGCRQDTLDDHLGAWNFRKVVGLGKQLLALLREAVPMKVLHGNVLAQFTASLRPEHVSKWREMRTAWHADNTCPDPYSQPFSEGRSLAKVKLELAKQEALDASAGVISPHEVSASTFLSTGLELEEQQRALKVLVANASAKSDVQAAEIQQKRNALRHRIDVWRKIQSIYMPGVSASLQDRNPSLDEHSEPSNSELSELVLPSNLAVSVHAALTLPGLAAKEICLRLAQADDCIHQLRRHLRIRATLWRYKVFNATGQKANTRTRVVIDRFQDKIECHVERYRAARLALVSLDPHGKWATRLLVLNDGDVRGPSRDDGKELSGKDRTSEGRHVPPWIWCATVAPEVGDPVGEMNDDMRVEWVKSAARLDRWSEEVTLVCEEMRRTLVFLEWRAVWWEGQADRRIRSAALDMDGQCVLDFGLQSGLCAYAMKQAVTQRALAKRFAELWVPFLRSNSLLPSLCAEWAWAVPITRRVCRSRPVLGPLPSTLLGLQLDSLMATESDGEDADDDERHARHGDSDNESVASQGGIHV